MTTPAAPLAITLLPAVAATDGELVDQITDLVNRVYGTAEEGLWVDGATRTTTSDMAKMIADGQIAVARAGGQIVGSVRVQQLDSGEGEFGLLVADPDRRGEGVGRELVVFAEELSRQRGLAVMQLEVLAPRKWTHPTKEFLHAWYTRIGYRPVRWDAIDESYPQLAALLATPCDFVVYHKDLGRQK
jgi:GNAT superfamily N-acetyltransferase